MANGHSFILIHDDDDDDDDGDDDGLCVMTTEGRRVASPRKRNVGVNVSSTKVKATRNVGQCPT